MEELEIKLKNEKNGYDEYQKGIYNIKIE